MNNKRKSTSILTLVFTFALACIGSTARADDGTTPPGQAQTPPAQAPAKVEQTTPAPKARKEDVDPTTLADAKSALKAARSERDEAEKTLADSRAENQRLSEQFNEATTAAENARAELATMTTARDNALAEKARTAEQLATAAANVERLEKLMKLKGVSPSAAVPLVSEADSTDDARDALVKNLAEAKDPLARGKAAEALRVFDAAQKKA